MSINARVNAKESGQFSKMRNKVRHLGSQDCLAGISSQAELGLRSVTQAPPAESHLIFIWLQSEQKAERAHTELVGQVQRGLEL